MGFIHRVRGAAGALWPLTIIGLVIGAVIGFAAVGLSSGSVTASALVRIGQPVDPTQVMTGQTAASDSTAGYVSGEIAYLADPGFSRSVGDRLGRSVAVTAVQNAQSPTITFSTTEPSDADAVATVNAAVDTYRQHVGEQNAARGDAALAALDSVIADLREQGGQSVRIEQLDLQRVAIRVQSRRAADVQVLQPAVVTAESATSRLLPAVGGALAGALLGLALSLAWRRISGTVVSRDAIEDEFPSVLTPTIRPGRRSGSAPTAADAATARSLLAQLHIPADVPARIVVVGASGRSRSDAVAALLAFAATEHPGSVEVTDCGGLGESADLIRSIDSATHIVTVVNIGVDTLEAAHVAAAVSVGTSAALSVVCTRTAWWQAPAPVAVTGRSTVAVAAPDRGAADVSAEPTTVATATDDTTIVEPASRTTDTDTVTEATDTEAGPVGTASADTEAATPATDADDTETDADADAEGLSHSGATDSGTR